jgi:negative regulator of flagellin synthesis FlgM
MKIPESSRPINEIVSQYKANETKVGPERQQSITSGVVPEEKVSLSPAAREIQQAEKAFRELPEVRQEKINELKERIAGGNYDVRGDKLAGKILSESILDIIA